MQWRDWRVYRYPTGQSMATIRCAEVGTGGEQREPGSSRKENPLRERGHSLAFKAFLDSMRSLR